MVTLTRKLLRDWKLLNRHYAHFNQRENALFLIRPQDSNLHIWHLVIRNPASKVELYLKLYIGGEEEPTIILKCLTPNTLYPIGRNISLTHLNYFLMEDGLLPLLQQIWRLFFDNRDVTEKSRLSFAWNRIMCKEFKVQFPELAGDLVPGDYAMVKNYHNNSDVASSNDVVGDAQQILAPASSLLPRGELRSGPDYCIKNLIACDDDILRAPKRNRLNGESMYFIGGKTEDDDTNEHPLRKKLRKQ